jgi:hypothetical protein
MRRMQMPCVLHVKPSEGGTWSATRGKFHAGGTLKKVPPQ